ncbi:MAG: DegV family protein [Firmicutes bacterium]|nr:DegV family protein [Bacillota bacterium]
MSFIISTDSSSDLLKGYLEKNNIYCIVMRRIQNGEEIGKIFESSDEFDAFYEDIKKGALPTTTLLNQTELEEYFKTILAKEPKGDIIHLPISCGLSATHANAVKAAAEINKTLKGRKIYVFDTLTTVAGLSMLVERLIAMRDKKLSAENALKEIERVRDHLHVWAMADNLFHLKRGGRISGLKAAMGTILGVKPIFIVNTKGKLTVEHKAKGHKEAINYMLEKLKTEGTDKGFDPLKNKIYAMRSSKSATYDQFIKTLKETYPNAIIEEGVVGPVVGTHVGPGVIGLIFEGAKRLNID